MRIVKGIYKGKEVVSDDIPNLRPTLGRVKETFFTLIENNITFEDSCVCDIFAGTGNLGLESLSRGAEKVYFVENNKNSLALIKTNIEKFNVKVKTEIIFADVMNAVKQLHESKVLFDIIILDPPFRKNYMNLLFADPLFHLLLRNDGILACEVEKNYKLQYRSSYWSLIKEKNMAESTLYILRRGDEESNLPGNL